MHLRSTPGTLLLALLLVAGCTDQSVPTAALNDDGPSLGTAAKNGVTQHVSIAGNDVCEAFGLGPGCDGNFSLTANAKEDGSVSGPWQDTFAGGGEGVHAEVDGLGVDGNTAVIGGVITKGTSGGTDVSGQRILTAAVDNGTTADDPPDQISFSYFPAEDFFGTADCAEVPLEAFTLLDLTRGQVKVQ